MIIKMNRGALLVLEGCDKAGKTTQAKMLLNALNELSIPAEIRHYPNRSTEIGKVIDKYLLGKDDFAPEMIHLLFSANRWELRNDMVKTLKSGVTLIVDRYVASGAAFSHEYTGRDFAWCKSPDIGLPSPDVTFLLEVNLDNQRLRPNFGHERFEKKEFQQKVAKNFQAILDPNTWKVVNADRSVEEIHVDILAETLTTIKKVKGKPIQDITWK